MAGRETLLSLIEDISRHSKQTAYIHRAQYRRFVWKYKEILEYAKRFAVLLDRQEVRKGDKVILWGENCPEWIITFLGCIFKGVVVVPVDEASTEDFACKVQKIVHAKMIVSSEGRSLPGEGIIRLYFRDLRDITAGIVISDFKPASVSARDTVEIVFTSGTTAEPKGVIISHRNIVSNLVPIENYLMKYGRWALSLISFRFLSLLPLSHMFGQALSIFLPLMMGRTVVIVNSLNPGSVARIIREEKVWVLISVPRIIESLKDFIIREYEKKRERGFQALYSASQERGLMRRIWMFRKATKPFGWRFRSIVSGGAALGRDTEEFWSRLGIAVVQGYGLTETAPIISINNPLTGKKGSIGRIVGDQQIRVGENGEILVRGANVTEGYLSESGIKSAASDEGWFGTGDLGEIDSEGYIFFKGRKKEVIVTAEGMNVFPEDVETALKGMDGVKECVVLGTERNGREEVHAVLLLRSPRHDPSAIVSATNELLNPHQRIKSFSVWKGSDFPRTATLKIKKRVVEAVLKGNVSGERTDAAGAEGRDPFSDIIREVSGKKDAEVNGKMDLSADLGLGSIDRVELLCALEERYQISIDEQEFSKCQSIEEVKQLLQGPRREIKEIRPPRWAITLPVRMIRAVAQRIFFLPFVRCFCSIRTQNIEVLRETRMPFIIVANHVSFLDAPVILASLPFRIRKMVAPLMMQEFFNDYLRPEGVPLYRRFLIGLVYFISTAFFNAYPFPTEGDYRKSMEYTGDIISKGFCPLIFPEGERTPTGRIGKFRPGIGMMIVNMKIPVLPVRTDGLHGVLPIDRYWPRRGKVSVRFGKLMTLGSGTYESIAERLESAVRSL